MRISFLVAMAATAIFIAATPAMAKARGGWSATPSPSPTHIETGLLGGFLPIPNINDDPHVQEIGRWAVSEHDKATNDGLRFNAVVSGQYQVVKGLNYRLVVDATDSHGRDAKYEAEVWEIEWENFRQLESFKPAN